MTIFIDSNIPMYLVGAEHPNKGRARTMLEEAVMREEKLITSAEVLQEILHRYVALNRRDAILPAFDALLGVVDDVLAIERRDVQSAGTLLFGDARLTARDALHLAVMKRHGITRIMSFDADFDGRPGMQRLGS